MGVFDLTGWRRKAAQLYKEAGRSSAAAEALSKAAKLVEDKNPQVCVLLFFFFFCCWYLSDAKP